MAFYRSDAFVLRTYKLGENDQIIVLFTRDYGKLRAVVRRSHSARRPTAGYYQPLMRLHTIMFGRPTHTLYRMQSVDIVQSFRCLHEDFQRLRCGLYMTELVDAATHERAPNPDLFDVLQDMFAHLEHTAAPREVLRVFELRLAILSGYAPQLHACVQCSRALQPQECAFSPRLGGLLCTVCAASVRPTLTVHPAALAYLRCLLVGAAPHESYASLTPEAQHDLEQLLHAHLTTCLGREMKSYAFLHL